MPQVGELVPSSQPIPMPMGYDYLVDQIGEYGDLELLLNTFTPDVRHLRALRLSFRQLLRHISNVGDNIKMFLKYYKDVLVATVLMPTVRIMFV